MSFSALAATLAVFFRLPLPNPFRFGDFPRRELRETNALPAFLRLNRARERHLTPQRLCLLGLGLREKLTEETLRLPRRLPVNDDAKADGVDSIRHTLLPFALQLNENSFS